MRLRRRLFWLSAIPIAAAALLAAGCVEDETCEPCEDVVAQIPWEAPEEAEYDLLDDGEDIGDARLTLEREGSRFVLEQKFSDDEGNTDESRVVADAETLKPFETRRVVIDGSQRREVESSYEPVDEDDCASGQVVIISQRVFSPPDEEEPDSERQSPLCVPEHSYDNDSSLFVWRTIEFEEGNTFTYHTLLTNQRETQVITLTVTGQERVDVPAGEFDAWRVEISAAGTTQVAWFATTDDRRLLQYNNSNLLFVLKE